LRQLEEENQQLKKLVADLSLDKQMLQDVLKKKALTPALLRGLRKASKTTTKHPTEGCAVC
jgi:hypothetical protein